MEQRHFRILLAILAGVAVVSLGVMIVGLARDGRAEGGLSILVVSRLLGYGLLVLAAVGLWYWQPWAFWLLGLATLTAIGGNLSEGVQTTFWRILLHLTIVLLTVEQYFTRKQASEEEEKSDAP